ncbi:25545_t:CDS:2, partial [Gigaspora margarita]
MLIIDELWVLFSKAVIEGRSTQDIKNIITYYLENKSKGPSTIINLLSNNNNNNYISDHQILLAFLHLIEFEISEEDGEKAFNLFSFAAENNNIIAQYFLGETYYYGYPRSHDYISEAGCKVYSQFNKAFKLETIRRHAEDSKEQKIFHELLLCLRDGKFMEMTGNCLKIG